MALMIQDDMELSVRSAKVKINQVSKTSQTVDLPYDASKVLATQPL
jgi:hypothetical protein